MSVKKLTIDKAKELSVDGGWFCSADVARMVLRDHPDISPESVPRCIRKLAERGFLVRLGDGFYRFKNVGLL